MNQNNVRHDPILGGEPLEEPKKVNQVREIKFRVWNPAKNEFFKPIYKGMEGQIHDVSISLHGQIIERTLLVPADIRNNYGMTVQQYTGVKDMNNQEVYEGDIVKCTYGYGQVVFANGCFMVQWIDDTEADMEFLAVNDTSKRQREGGEQFKIIGNIYETPELLTP